MANDLSVVIPQLLAQGLLALRENCVMPRLVNSDYSTLAAQKGSTIDVPIPSAIVAADVAPGNVPPATADVQPTVAQIPLDQWKESAFYMTDKDLKEVLQGVIPMQASEAIKALGNVVNAHILSKYKAIYGHVGTAGTTPFVSTTTDVTGARKVLNKQLSPLYDRRIVIDPDAEANALNLQAFQDVSWTGENGVIQDGLLKQKFGFTWSMDQLMQTHTPGTSDDASADGVSVVGNAFIHMDAVVGGKTMLAGDLITLAGSDYQYVVTADTTIPIDTGAGVNVPISPTVQEAHADDAAVSYVAAHVVNLAFHRDCFAFASRPLADNTTGLGNLIQSAVDPVSGISLRLEISREHKRTRYAYDILYGAAIVRPEFGCRILG